MVVVGGKFEGANLDIFALILFLVIEKACECPTSRMKNCFYPTPLLIGQRKQINQIGFIFFPVEQTWEKTKNVHTQDLYKLKGLH